MRRENFKEEDWVAEVLDDFALRRAERKLFEAQWRLNTNFVLGNQYCYIDGSLEVEDREREYFWQEREVYNHLAPIVETRLAKLSKVRPQMSVRPSSSDDEDIKTAKVCSKILSGVTNALNMEKLINTATMWSEVVGSVFYKITWDNSKGCKLDNELSEGDVSVTVCPSYEIFPSSLACQSIDEASSIIHAKAMSVDDILISYAKAVKAEDIDVVTLENFSVFGGLNVTSTVPKVGRSKKKNYCMLIERYTRPNKNLPKGELIVVAGKTLLYRGDLPYRNGVDGGYSLPFVAQNCIDTVGAFYGSSVVERAIPIQRAYNAVKNRKHEFLNRIAMGVLAVEDGSVDIENLEAEGLSPGKILLYRQGSTPPRFLDSDSVPPEFSYEEDRLLSEFVSISGVSDFMRSSRLPSNLTSGIALQLLIEQDDTRLTITADNVRRAIREVAQHILRLYKQFAVYSRLTRFVGSDGDIELISWNNSMVGSDDVELDTVSELSTTQATKQSMMFELLRAGLLQDEDGKLKDSTRYKVLESLGYGGYESAYSVDSLHIKKAERENKAFDKQSPDVDSFDAHKLHIDVHTAYMLGSEFLRSGKSKTKEKIIEHIAKHTAMLAE